MKGIVFREFLDMVEARYSCEVADRMLMAADVPSGGAYTTVGTYDHREMQALLTALSSETGQPVAQLMRQFGQHLAARFVRLYPHFFTLQPTLWDFLASLEPVIHVDVRKLYPDAEFPQFIVRSRREGGMELAYRSSRHMQDLAEGLIEGVARHYRTPVAIARRAQADGIVFDITAHEHVLVD